MKDDKVYISLALSPDRDEDILSWYKSIPIGERESLLLAVIRDHLDQREVHLQTEEEMKQELLREILQKIRYKIDEIELKINEEKGQTVKMKRENRRQQQIDDPESIDERLDELIDFF